jgi:hypothetical protein
MVSKNYNVGNLPPEVSWTVVRGDSARFRVFVTDDNKQALDLDNWQVDLEIRRDGNLIVALQPTPAITDAQGFFTVTLTPFESELLETDDVFDIQLWDGEETVWTVAQGKMFIIEDVTSAPPFNLES